MSSVNVLIYIPVSMAKVTSGDYSSLFDWFKMLSDFIGEEYSFAMPYYRFSDYRPSYMPCPDTEEDSEYMLYLDDLNRYSDKEEISLAFEGLVDGLSFFGHKPCIIVALGNAEHHEDRVLDMFPEFAGIPRIKLTVADGQITDAVSSFVDRLVEATPHATVVQLNPISELSASIMENRERTPETNEPKGSDASESEELIALGECYLNGWGVETSYDEARRLFQQAANEGNPDGEYLLGMMSRKGLGCHANMFDSMRWLNSAAQHGHGKASLEMAKIAYEDDEWQFSDKDL